MPLSDTFGRVGTVAFPQMVSEVPNENTGVTRGITVTDRFIGIAQVLAAGVNVYKPEAWLLTAAGDHVPGIPLLEVVAKTGAGLP